MKKFRIIIMTTIVLAIVAFAVVRVAGTTSTSKPLDDKAIQKILKTVGASSMHKKLPNLTIKTLEGNGKISLHDYEGKVLLLPIWVSWCHYCQRDILQMVILAKKLSNNNDLAIVSISIDENISDARTFVQERGVTFPVLIDPKGVQHNNTEALKIRGTPTTFIIDPNGIIIGKTEGYHEWNNPSTVAAIKKLVKELMTQYRSNQNTGN